MKKKKIIVLYMLIFVLSIISAFIYYRKDENTIALSNMINNKFVLDYNKLCFYSKKGTKKYDIIKSKYKYIYYFDSTCCSPCIMNRLSIDDSIHKKFNNEKLKCIYIFDSSLKDTSAFYNNYIFSEFAEDVFLDTTHLVATNNNYITSNIVTHIFLIDENNVIRLVGNPIKNEKVKSMLFDIIK